MKQYKKIFKEGDSKEFKIVATQAIMDARNAGILTDDFYVNYNGIDFPLIGLTPSKALIRDPYTKRPIAIRYV